MLINFEYQVVNLNCHQTNHFIGTKIIILKSTRSLEHLLNEFLQIFNSNSCNTKEGLKKHCEAIL